MLLMGGGGGGSLFIPKTILSHENTWLWVDKIQMF